MYSMTGYGRAEYHENGINLLVELKTVNNRNLDFNSKIPRAFICFEDAMRNLVKEHINRGRADLYLSFSDTNESDSEISVDNGLVKAYYAASEKISDALNIPNDFSVSRILFSEGVIKDDGGFKDYSFLEPIVLKTLKNALDNLNAMRLTEGKKLIADMSARMITIEELVKKIKARAPLVAAEYKEKLKERVSDFLQDVNYDEARLLNEVAFFTDKSNIDEELTRLNSHISQFYKIIEGPLPGKKLDFLIQEFNRETNTICSKSNDLEITSLGLSLKNEIEKIREQVQNVE